MFEKILSLACMACFFLGPASHGETSADEESQGNISAPAATSSPSPEPKVYDPNYGSDPGYNPLLNDAQPNNN